MRKGRKIISAMLALTMVVSLTACGEKKAKETGSKENASKEISFDQLKLGEDYKDIKANIKMMTHRTDLTDNVFLDYEKQFKELYPNVSIEFEGITNYADDMTTRLTTPNWGDICMIPDSVDKSELSNYFVSYGKLDTLSNDYIMLDNKSFDGNTYGMPSVGNAQGVVYNKKVFKDAGVTEIPKTPDEFLDALQQIKDKTDAIPLYSNFSAQWTMGAWDAIIGGSSNGSPDYKNEKLLHGKNPFSRNEEMIGPYAVYYVLYEATKRGLIEDDPTTSDWEGCKGMINNGQIGAMVLGSWAVTQMQAAGDHADDIGYMSFPITVDGKQSASAGPDYAYGININSSEDNQIASMLFVKWLTEKSGFAKDQGGIPIVKGGEYPEALKGLSGVELIIESPAIEGEEGLFEKVNLDSEVGLNTDPVPDCEILEHALHGDKTLDEIMDDWNKRWTQAQEDNDVTINE